ncbi:hypothetical protein GCM10010174_23710 [Kutzneria viridogrisea]|uniref:Uncharacterized protein n=1 Tax=Kutzneria viridogrisea TaxID=47990 RepID=A0ABR6BWJ2_9PSEU|nr:hypothetical protein [Kutzneria viridogrisea]
MRRRPPTALALPAAAALLALCATPAFAVPTTTPVPSPVNPGQPPASAALGPQPLGHAVGDAGGGLAVIRLLPNSQPTGSILPDLSKDLPKQPLAEAGFGLSSAQANTEAYLAYERAIAQASPMGFAVGGNAPQTPGALAQTALPDNPQATTGGLNPPSTPLDALLKVGLLNGSVHARWSDTLGPCVDTIADAQTSLASLSVLNAIPSLPSKPDLTGLINPSSKLDANTAGEVVNSLKSMSAPLSQLGGLLSGKQTEDGKGSLLSLPNTLSSRSVVKLVDIPGSKNKAVQSTSTLQVASVKILAGTPMEIDINVVSQPTLQVTSGGDEKSSSVAYTAPVLQVVQGGKTLGTLDAANPKLDVPVGVPLPGADQLGKLPIIGQLLPNGSAIPDGFKKIDIGVLRLQIAELDKKSQALTGQPFAGYQVGATARLLDLQLLPTDALGLPNLPSALAQVTLGEQVARAAAPTGGVECGSTPGPGGSTTAAPPAPQGSPPLAYTNAAYDTIPLFWTGTAFLLAGVVVVAALPHRRAKRATKQ